jgi:hypothetical protein
LIINFLTVDLNAQVFSNGFNTIGGNRVGIRTNTPTSSLTIEPLCTSIKRDSPLNVKYCHWLILDGVVIPSPLSALYVSQDGKVGLRTENPAEALDVHGNAKIGNNGWTSLTLDGTGDNDWMFNAHNDEESLNIRTTPNGSSSWSSYVMVLKRNSGNVGIGVANPSERLNINGNLLVENGNIVISNPNGLGTGDNQIALNSDGTIRAREVRVDLATIPDYVFADGYELMPLEELGKFVKTNKHLPGVKSEAQFEEEGSISLTEMNLKLLEKVEELTLYILQLEKRISSFEK